MKKYTTTRATVLLAILAVMLVPLSAQAQRRNQEARIGYLLPAGGQQGTTFEVLVVGTRIISQTTDAIISGDGVDVKIIKVYKPIRPVNGTQRKLIREKITQAMQQLDGKVPLPPKRSAGKKRSKSSAKNSPKKSPKIPPKNPDEEEIPSHPLIDKLKNPTKDDLQRIVYEYFAPRQRIRPSAAFASSVLLRVTIDRNATPGDRELRLVTRLGLSHPMYFQVGTAHEILELEPNDPHNLSADTPTLKVPVVINGQIRPGDVDRFRFRAARGQNLVILAQARQLVPYLADAVPGWFEAVVTLYDPDGKEIDFSDCYQFNPDPILLHRTTKPGEYTVEIRDSIYRGREDFVYRLSIGRNPLVTSITPLGGQPQKPLEVALTGENLPRKTLTLDTSPGKGRLRQTHFLGKRWCPCPISYAVDSLPECKEATKNDSCETAQPITLPKIINGVVKRPNDVDWFRFEGRAGQTVVVEVVARALNSPLDSVIQLLDASGKVLATNDDHELPNIGLKTHHADSYLRRKLPKSGVYFVQLRDTRGHGSPTHGYRLRISPPQPDFMVYITPSGINLPARGSVPVRFHVLRKDGFDGPIEIRLSNEESYQFTLHGATIPQGEDQVVCTLSAPNDPTEFLVPLRLEAYCSTDMKNGVQSVVRPVLPVDHWEQAFIYKHLVPAEELIVAVTRARGPAIRYRLADSTPVQLKVGGKTTVLFESQMPPFLRKQVDRQRKQFSVNLVDPPEGVRLIGKKIESTRLELTFKIDAEAVKDKDPKKLAARGNLIVEIQKTVSFNRPNGKGKATRRVPVTILPPIPFERTL